MTVATHHPRRRSVQHRPLILVWIDSREAFIVRWQDERGHVERLESDVPAHHRATGEMRPDPGIEAQRLEHLARFVGEVAQHLGSDDDVLVLGPGTVHGQLERHLQAADHGRDRPRAVTSEASSPLTEHQLIARLREEIGAAPRRRRALRPPHTRPAGQPPRQKHVPIAELENEEDAQ